MKERKSYIKTPSGSGLYKDTPEARLVMAIVGQAVNDYIDIAVRAQWDELTPIAVKDAKRCRQYILNEAPFTHGDVGKRIMQHLNAVNVPTALAYDRRRRLGCVQRDKKRITEAEAKIARYAEDIQKLEAVPGRVQASQKEFPYIRASVKTEMVNPIQKWRIEDKIRREEAYIERLRRSIDDVTAFVKWCNEPLRGALTRAFLEGTTKAADEAKALHVTKRAFDMHIFDKAEAYCNDAGKPSFDFLKGKTSN